jgi:hypothetical protein
MAVLHPKISNRQQNIPTVNTGQCKVWAVEAVVNAHARCWPKGPNM